jgi:hypothetical protein
MRGNLHGAAAERSEPIRASAGHRLASNCNEVWPGYDGPAARTEKTVAISAAASADEQAFVVNRTAGYGVKPYACTSEGEAFDRPLLGRLATIDGEGIGSLACST